MKSRVLFVSAVLIATAAPAFAQTQTAQSAMVKINLESEAYQIEGTTTWTFDRGTHNAPGLAMTYYTNGWNLQPPTVACSGGGQNGCQIAPATPAAPAPLPVQVQQHTQDERCTFFTGGTLKSEEYKQVVQVNLSQGASKGNWSFTFTYVVAPTLPFVPERTAWTSEQTGGSVNIEFAGFVASESYQKQSNRNKYSFTMGDGGITRARNVSASLMNGSATLGTLDLNNVDTDADFINDGLAVGSAVEDFVYFANGNVFGNSAAFSALHATGGKGANSVVNIVTGNDAAPVDNFAGNNNDLAAGAIHIGPYAGAFQGLTEKGNYRIRVAGVFKGNSASADLGFSVLSKSIVIGGCEVK